MPDQERCVSSNVLQSEHLHFPHVHGSVHCAAEPWMVPVVEMYLLEPLSLKSLRNGRMPDGDFFFFATGIQIFDVGK